MQDHSFGRDCAALLREQTEGRLIPRRKLLKLCAALGVAPALFRPTPVGANPNEIVLVNWGGDAVTAFAEAFADPFMANNPAIRVVVDGAGPSSGRIKAMVESGVVTWDVCDRNIPASLELGREDLLEEIDYGVVDRAKVRETHAGRWGVGNYIFSNVLTYDTQAFDGRVPTTWADFWNLQDFPGTRTLRRHIDGQLEAALLADGVAPEDLYPIDVDRALEKIREIREHTIFWGTGAESQQVFRDGEVVMGNLFNTRASVALRESGGRIDFTFNEGLVWVGAWIVPKGNPAGAAVWDFIASTQDPEGQVALLELLGNGPVNPAAADLVPEDLRRIDPGNPDNYARQIEVDAEWYADHSAEVLSRYIEVISS